MSSWQWTVDASLTIQVEPERTEQDVLAYATHVAHQAHGEGVFVDVYRMSEAQYRVIIYYGALPPGTVA
jgi:hypothetical protein